MSAFFFFLQGSELEKFLYKADYFVDDMSTKQYKNLLQGCQTGIILILEFDQMWNTNRLISLITTAVLRIHRWAALQERCF